MLKYPDCNIIKECPNDKKDIILPTIFANSGVDCRKCLFYRFLESKANERGYFYAPYIPITIYKHPFGPPKKGDHN